jgi:membrane protein DedA with SNARE-associated domain
MLGVLAKHSVAAILLAVFLEELGIPMPIPTDLLIIFAGAVHAQTPMQFAGWVFALSLVSVVGASGLYGVVRRGGRPLVERYGPYVHLGPAQLARSEAWLNRHGWIAIAVGRAIPGLRYATVIACGLLNVPYRLFFMAHLIGSLIYIMLFLSIGRVFGPGIIELIHTPHGVLRLLWLVTLAVGLPLLFVWWAQRSHVRQPDQPSRLRILSAVLVASFAGATALAATWAAAAAVIELLGAAYALPPPAPLLGARLARRLSYFPLMFSILLLLCTAISIAYYEFILPRLSPRIGTLLWQVLDMVVLGSSVVAGVVSTSFVVAPGGFPVTTWRVGMAVVIVLLLSVVSYSVTVVYGRVLAIAVLPSFRWWLRMPAREQPLTSPNGEVTRLEPLQKITERKKRA